MQPSHGASCVNSLRFEVLMRYECMSICSWNILKNEGETHCNNPQQRLWQVLLSFLFYIYVESHLRLSSVSFQFHAHLWILNISLLKRSKGKVYFLSVKRKNGDRWAWMRLKFTRGPWMHHSTQNKEAERSGHGEEWTRRGIFGATEGNKSQFIPDKMTKCSWSQFWSLWGRYRR